MAPRVLTQRHLNRAVPARQLLLERGRSSIPKTLERIGGIQAQYAPSMYVGLWTRLEGFERDLLTRALEKRAVVQGTLMRITIHGDARTSRRGRAPHRPLQRRKPLTQARRGL